ncbi:MAG: hypothetical protein AMXMBFR13_13130 [Phycisphaerae bacterium]
MSKTSQLAVMAAVVLAGATGAFAAVGLSLTQSGGADWPLAQGEQITLDLNLVITGDEAVAGYSFFPGTSMSGSLHFVSRANLSQVLTENNWDPPFDPPIDRVLDPWLDYDLGARSLGLPGLDALFAPGEMPTQRITFLALQDLPADTQILLGNASWIGPDGMAVRSFDWLEPFGVPEPGVGLLLAAGVAILLGKRRAG